ncbi:unnamed protein product [Brassicogethes aeneus]|uniref:Suppressor of forked domain-containing protein n=1 Tax=Brassicogethes aeneus TaxID=1431903 RepID=A0A9P0AWH1_BRAAE|nr:unnamed protein product [Brassicogethes aeneus]
MTTEERLHIDWGNDKLHRTQKQVERNPYDLEAWSILLRESQTKHISEVRALYEHLIGIFPSASRYWRIYIEHEMKSRNFERVEKVCILLMLFLQLED